MKQNLSLLLLLFLFPFGFYAQNEWVSVPSNPNVSSSIYDIEMLEGKILQFSYWNNGNDVIQVDLYSPSSGTWTTVSSLNVQPIQKIITEKIGNQVFLACYDGTNFNFYNFNESTSNLDPISSPYPFSNVNGNWKFHAGKNSGELYVLFTSGFGPSDVHGLEYNSGSSSWTYTTADVQTSADLSIADLQIHSTNDQVFFGVYSNKLRVTFFNKGNIATMFGYDGGVGEILSSGSSWNNPGFALIGDNSSTVPSIYLTEDANYQSYDEPIVTGNTIDLNLANPNTGFNVNADYLETERSASHGFLFSTFSFNGSPTFDKLLVLRKDFIQATSWDTLGLRLEPAGLSYEIDQFHLSLDNNQAHVAAGYTFLGSPTNELKVFNTIPYHVSGTTNPSNSICAGVVNELYPMIELFDDDYEQIHIVDAYSLNTETTAIQVIPFGYSNGTSKFKILGIPSGNLDQIVLVFSDNWSTNSLTLDAYQSNASPINLQFNQSPLKFCSNETQIDLSTKVNYYDQGTFRLNGQELYGTLVDAQTLASITPAGIVRYTVNVDGCFVTTTENYVIVDAASVNITTNPASCGNATGSATATITQGTSSTVDFYWSTGETSTTISDLQPGAYYIHIEDGNACKTTGLASIEASEASLSFAVTDVTCFGAENGAIDLTISSSVPYDIVWSNGKRDEDISNLTAGNYWVTYYGSDGCELSSSVTVNGGSEIAIDFTLSEPDCGTANGSINATVSGGDGSYSYQWNSSQQTATISNLSQGFYALTVTDGQNCIATDSIYLNDNYAHQLVDSLMLPDCFSNNGGINLTLIEHPNGGPINSILWSNGASTEDIYNLSEGIYTVRVESGVNCVSEKTIFLSNKAPLRNDICLVSVDLASTSNLVVWEKLETSSIDYYKIYREDLDAGQFKLIDTVHSSNLSVFNDVVASPMQRSWRYRISAVNTCGVEGPISEAHKTLHLNTIEQVTPGTFDVYWDAYEGLSSGQYVVNRFTDQLGWVSLSPSVPFGSPTVFTDSPPLGSTGIDYYVDLELQIPCEATFKAQDFNKTRSNKDRGIFNPGEGAGDYSNNDLISIQQGELVVLIYPNPTNENLTMTLTIDGISEIEIRDVSGKLIYQQEFSGKISEIPTAEFQAGMYSITLKSGVFVASTKFVKY